MGGEPQPRPSTGTLRSSAAAWLAAIESGEVDATAAERAYVLGAADMLDALDDD
jgi:hypothetical protein